MFPTQIWSKLYVITTEMWIRVCSMISQLWQLPVEILVGEVSVWVNSLKGLKFVIATHLAVLKNYEWFHVSMGTWYIITHYVIRWLIKHFVIV